MIITLTGSSGAGKSSCCREILLCKPEWRIVPSFTSRAPRQKDLPGEYICNVSQDEFEQMKADGKILWSINEHGNTYVTAGQHVEEAVVDTGVHIMPIAPNTVEILRKLIEQKKLLHFYLLSPSKTELRKRLGRRNFSEEEILRRISDCQSWDSEAVASNIPYNFVQGDTTIKEAADDILKVCEEFLGKGGR